MKSIVLEGNKGGDYLRIEQDEAQEKTDTCYIEVGSCCVTVMKANVPIELITSLFAHFSMTKPDGFSRSTKDKLSDYAREVMGWKGAFLEERISRIEEF